MKKVSDPPDDLYALRLKKASGSIITQDRFVAFLYTLMRDQVTPGHVEYIMLQVDKETQRDDFPGKFALTNGWLGSYALDVARRLAKRPGKKKKNMKRVMTKEKKR